MKKRIGIPIPGEVEELRAIDFRIITNAGRTIGLGDVVRLTGKISVYLRDDRIDCSMFRPTVQLLD